MERRVLENRQLIPAISDRHLIRKIARHFHHEIEVAIITRGVDNIQQFEQLLQEFMTVRGDSRSLARVKHESANGPERKQHRPLLQQQTQDRERRIDREGGNEQKNSYPRPNNKRLPTCEANVNAIASISNAITQNNGTQHSKN